MSMYVDALGQYCELTALIIVMIVYMNICIIILFFVVVCFVLLYY